MSKESDDLKPLSTRSFFATTGAMVAGAALLAWLVWTFVGKLLAMAIPAAVLLLVAFLAYSVIKQRFSASPGNKS